ncbi:MAG TPA: bis(5'-nucleosyl)-tetraphosphatase (symmetrical) YqeK [Candidatus Obscuribacterales bacterium]
MGSNPEKKATNTAAFGHAGVPEAVTLDFASQWVRTRLSEKRYRHVAAVARLAGRLATKSGCNPYLAELAGWLHDACKQLKDRELVSLAEQQGLKLLPIERASPHVLHGPVAAGLVRRELNLTNEEVLDAISQHTLGEAPMGLLSKVVFLADCLEEGRPQEYAGPIWEALDLDGAFDMDRAVLTACDLSLRSLIDDGKPIHPKTLEVRNYYLDLLAHR